MIYTSVSFIPVKFTRNGFACLIDNVEGQLNKHNKVRLLDSQSIENQPIRSDMKLMRILRSET